MNSKNNTVDESQLDDLAPCPFCFGPAQSDFIVDTSYIIECQWCEARTGCQDGPEEAVAEWNRRAAQVSDGDFAAIVKRYEDAGDVHNVEIIRKQWEVARASRGFLVTAGEVRLDPAPAVAEVQRVDTRAALSALCDLAGALLLVQRINASIGEALAAIAKMEATEAVSVMLWLYRRLPHGYGRPPHIERVIERLAVQAGIEVAECLAERGPR